MPFIPCQPKEISEMLNSIGIENINQLFDEIPNEIKSSTINLPQGLSEMAIGKLMRERANQDPQLLNFAGGGAYEHHIPAAVWQIATRGEFYSSYTPYQAEASQGTLQVIYEFQSMICELLAMDCSNASLYDGATAAVEAVLMMARINPNKPKTILVPRSLSPRVREVLKSILSLQNIEIIELSFEAKSGKTSLAEVEKFAKQAAGIIIPQPNYFGVLEDVDELTDLAKKI